MPVATFSNAVAAYNATARAARGDDGGALSADKLTGQGSEGVNFASMLKQGLQSAVQTGKTSEALSEQAIAGKADVREVAAAVSNAEMTLQTVLAVRDKVISAYNQIMQMPI